MSPASASEYFNERFAAWLRIEPRCRQASLERGVQARTADPLWMLARQWQTGEFLGQDAGSPIRVEMSYSTQSIDKIKLGSGPSQPLPPDLPLETLVEQELGEINCRERVRIGQEFERRLRARLKLDGMEDQVGDLIDDLRGGAGFPVDGAETAGETLDRATRRFVRFMRNRVIDGQAVLDGHVLVPEGSPTAQGVIDQVRDEVLDWYAQVCNRPVSKQPPAWQPERLDYRFETMRAVDAWVGFGEMTLWTKATRVEREGIAFTDCGGFPILVGGTRPSGGRQWNPVLVCPAGVRIALHKPASELKVVVGCLGEPRFRCFGNRNTEVQAVIVREAITAPQTVQLDQAGTVAHQVRIRTYRISHRGVAKVEIHGQVAVEGIVLSDVEEPQLVAPDYRNGALDWYTFSASTERARGEWQAPADPALDAIVTTPTRLEVTGTSPRWWAFEDGSTDFGALDVAKPDLAKLLLMDFVLIHGDDWFSVPAPVPIGSLVKVDSLRIWNVFGEEVVVDPARVIDGDPSERFDLFTIASAGTPDAPGLAANADQDGAPPRPILLIPPVTGFRQESPPLDQVRFLRDEGANTVWGVEHIVPNGLGRPVSGFDAQRECLERQRDALKRELVALQRRLEYGDPSDEERAALEAAIHDLQDQILDLTPDARPTPLQDGVPRYRLATAVPENWIPFIPVQRGALLGARRAAIQFRRAKMLRNTDHKRMADEGQTLSEYLANDKSISAMSRLLALDEWALLFLNEESVPRAGLRVQLTKQRVRWVDGSTHVWLGRKVLTSRGEGSSGLRFDVVTE